MDGFVPLNNGQAMQVSPIANVNKGSRGGATTDNDNDNAAGSRVLYLKPRRNLVGSISFHLRRRSPGRLERERRTIDGAGAC